jgi:hypothetical protein
MHSFNVVHTANRLRSINNKLGARLTLFLGSMGYSIYIGSYLLVVLRRLLTSVTDSYHPRTTELHSKAGPFMIVAGTLLGVCAGLLWTAHGSLTLAYPTGNVLRHTTLLPDS